jgi:hypothetical protein
MDMMAHGMRVIMKATKLLNSNQVSATVIRFSPYGLHWKGVMDAFTLFFLNPTGSSSCSRPTIICNIKANSVVITGGFWRGESLRHDGSNAYRNGCNASIGRLA